MLISQVFLLGILPSHIILVQTSCLYRHWFFLVSAAALPVQDHPLQTVSDHPCKTDN